MAAAPNKKVDRNQIYQEIKKMIQETKEKEVEISSSELADKFGVQAPTMDYHLNKLVEEGRLAISPKRGRYNRKIYRLASEEREEPVQQKGKTEVVTPESAERFKQFLEMHLKKEKNNQKEDKKEEVQQTPVATIEKKTESAQEMGRVQRLSEEQEEQEKIEQPTFVTGVDVPAISAKGSRRSASNTTEEPIVPVQELTLDQRIEQFLQEANQVHDANMLLKHEDREILSVMNETIHQTSIYLKDLSEQLSTIQNKKLIQGLIDDRNRMQDRIEQLERQVQDAQAQVTNTKEKYEIDPSRVRFMHQMIISTVDDFVNRPNHAMALGRTEFRNKITKEVSDLAKYVLHLEK